MLSSSDNDSLSVSSTTKAGRINSGTCVSSSRGAAEPYISCTTFNILAPIYKRIDQQNQTIRESQFRSCWLTRNERILDWLLFEKSSIICLQEFWVANQDLVRMYEDRLGDAGYLTFQLARTNNRGDGLLTAVHKDYFTVLSHKELLFNDFGDRVAQLLHVELLVPLLQNRPSGGQQEVLIVNTHLLFPHDSSLSIVRLRQVYKILKYVETYQKDNKLDHIPVILCGDWNGSKRGQVYRFLRSQGFVSSYDLAHHYTDSDADAHKWVSHQNHRGNICGVDFIWLRNPGNMRKQLISGWADAVFGIVKYQLQKASLVENDAFTLFKADNHGAFITYQAFCQALREVSLIGLPYGLSFQETRDLWSLTDLDGNGEVDYEQFKGRIWNCTRSEQRVDICNASAEESRQQEEAIGFSVKEANLQPREVERGIWPESYSLSDHARLTATFLPVKIQLF